MEAMHPMHYLRILGELRDMNERLLVVERALGIEPPRPSETRVDIEPARSVENIDAAVEERCMARARSTGAAFAERIPPKAEENNVTSAAPTTGAVPAAMENTETAQQDTSATDNDWLNNVEVGEDDSEYGG